MSGQSDWQYLTPYNIGQPGSNVRANGGAGVGALHFRDPLDARRAMTGDRVPQAEYPDGYLGTIQSRREDRLLNSVKGRLTQRSYQRGIHKGERIDPQDYLWDETFNPQTGLEYQARGLKWTQRGSAVERLQYLGQTEFSSEAEKRSFLGRFGVSDTPLEVDPVRQQKLSRLLPKWR